MKYWKQAGDKNWWCGGDECSPANHHALGVDYLGISTHPRTHSERSTHLATMHGKPFESETLCLNQREPLIEMVKNANHAIYYAICTNICHGHI